MLHAPMMMRRNGIKELDEANERLNFKSLVYRTPPCPTPPVRMSMAIAIYKGDAQRSMQGHGYQQSCEAYDDATATARPTIS